MDRINWFISFLSRRYSMVFFRGILLLLITSNLSEAVTQISPGDRVIVQADNWVKNDTEEQLGVEVVRLSSYVEREHMMQVSNKPNLKLFIGLALGNSIRTPEQGSRFFAPPTDMWTGYPTINDSTRAFLNAFRDTLSIWRSPQVNLDIAAIMFNLEIPFQNFSMLSPPKNAEEVTQAATVLMKEYKAIIDSVDSDIDFWIYSSKGDSLDAEGYAITGTGTYAHNGCDWEALVSPPNAIDVCYISAGMDISSIYGTLQTRMERIGDRLMEVRNIVDYYQKPVVFQAHTALEVYPEIRNYYHYYWNDFRTMINYAKGVVDASNSVPFGTDKPVIYWQSHYGEYYNTDDAGLPPSGMFPWSGGGNFPARLWEDGHEWDWARNYLTPNVSQPHNVWEREFIMNFLLATGSSIPAHQITTNEVWSGEIHLVGDVEIMNGATLTIQPGAHINLRPNTDIQQSGAAASKVEIIVHNGAALSAIGNVSSPIVFQSSANDDPNFPTGENRDDWQGIMVEEGGSLLLKNCLIRDAEVGIDVEPSNNTSLITTIEVRETDFMWNEKGMKIEVQDQPPELILENIGLYHNMAGIETQTYTSNDPGQIDVINATVSDNFQGFGLVSSGSGNQRFLIKNSILSYNTYGAYSSYPGTSEIDFKYSDFYLNSTTFHGGVGSWSVPPSGGDHVGNLSNDPAFVDHTGEDYHLQTSSAVINKGDPNMTEPDSSPINMGRYGGTSEYTQITTSMPSPWINGDVGEVGVSGGATYSNGTFTVNGSGVDIWDYDDGFHYVYQSLSGNGWISASIESIENTNEWAKVGVMIRESLASDAPHAMMVLTPGHGAIIQGRSNVSGSSSHPASTSGGTPRWVKIERSGNTFTGYVSDNSGTSWSAVGSMSAYMGSNVLMGLCVTAHDNNTLNTSTFNNVSVSASSGGGGGNTIPNGDFEDGLNNWTATGSWILNGAWTVQHDPYIEQPGRIGDFAGSYPPESGTGTLTSSNFTINKHYLNFRIGGQDNANANKVRLFVDGQMVKEVGPPGDNGFEDVSWDVSNTNWAGKTAYIECVDGNSNGGYAWFCVDEFHLSDTFTASSVTKPVVAVKIVDTLPDTFTVAQNIPNPFNPETTIAFTLPRESDVMLKIYNILGQEVRVLVQDVVAGGRHQVVWNGRDKLGQLVSSGIYFYRFQAGPLDETKKMLILK